MVRHLCRHPLCLSHGQRNLYYDTIGFSRATCSATRIVSSQHQLDNHLSLLIPLFTGNIKGAILPAASFYLNYQKYFSSLISKVKLQFSQNAIFLNPYFSSCLYSDTPFNPRMDIRRMFILGSKMLFFLKSRTD